MLRQIPDVSEVFHPAVEDIATDHGVKLFGNDVAGVEAHDRPSLGIGYMPEDRRLVPQLTVEENILLPSWVIEGLDHEGSLNFIYDLMPELLKMKDRKALLLSGGQQKMVALGRALMAGTKLLVLDEPFEGVAPALANRLLLATDCRARNIDGSGRSLAG